MSTRATVWCLAVSGLLLAACSGSDGPAGPAGLPGEPGPPGDPGAPGAPGSPDTGAQVLEKLTEVDGEGSGLDADSLDGLDSTDFARRGRRSITLPVTTETTGDTSWSSLLRLPLDMDMTKAFSLNIFYLAGSGGAADCTFHVVAGATTYAVNGGTGGSLLVGDQDLVGDGNYATAEFSATFDDGIDPGRWVGVYLIADQPGTCIIYSIDGMAFEYDQL